MKNKIFIFSIILFLTIYFSESYGQDFTDHGNIDGPPVTRSEVILTAHAYTRIHWEMKELNQKGISCNENFISDYSTGHRIGMGYMWGGWDSIDDFLDKIKKGYGTGTGGYVSYKEYPKDCVTGTSCTGLVSRAWHLNRKYTLNYPQYPEIKEQFHRITHEIPGVDYLNHKTNMLKKGDAFINKEHIILFVYETRGRTPMVIDSRVKGVSFRETSWRELHNFGYKAIRYNNIKEVSNPQGTILNPIIIDSDDLPAVLNNNTRDFVSMKFDRYSIDTSLNEQGPEVVFKLQMKSKKRINIYLNELINEGIDNNIYLLKSLNRKEKYIATDCIAQGDSWINQELVPGSYYVVVDSGKDQPGEFKLTIEYSK